MLINYFTVWLIPFEDVSLRCWQDKCVSDVTFLIHREWYSYHFPELSKIVADNITFARLAQLIGRRSSLNESMLVTRISSCPA